MYSILEIVLPKNKSKNQIHSLNLLVFLVKQMTFSDKKLLFKGRIYSDVNLSKMVPKGRKKAKKE